VYTGESSILNPDFEEVRSMNPPAADKVREAVSQGRWDLAVSMLQQFDPAAAADLIMGMPIEQQQVLFRVVPVDFAATLVSQFPYYHSYVLLHTRSLEHLRAILDKMDPDDRMLFLEELPGEAWQRVMDEISGKFSSQGQRETGSAADVAGVLAGPILAAASIMEAVQVEKSFRQPDGPGTQVIAPT